MRSIEIWKKRPNFSGTGSRGKLAQFKADFVNKFITENKIESIIDFGCGDLENARLLKVKKYLGIDIVEHAHPSSVLSDTFETVVSRFDLFESTEKADLSLCMDVLYHILEDEREYLKNTLDKIIESTKKYFIIYAQDSYQSDEILNYRNHLFNCPWRQILETKNVRLIDEQKKCQPESSARFFVYEKF